MLYASSLYSSASFHCLSQIISSFPRSLIIKKKSLSAQIFIPPMENSQEKEKRKHPEDDDLLTLSLSYAQPVRARQSTPPPELPILTVTPPIQHMLSQPIPVSPLVPSMQALFLSQISPQLPFQLPSTQPLLVPPPASTNQLISNEEASDPAPAPAVPLSRPVRNRRNPTQGPREGKSDTIPPPFPWATNRRAIVHSLKYLLQNQIFTVTGDVQCKRCERKFEMGFDLKEKFGEVWKFIVEHKGNMHDRAPNVWLNPILPTCRHCGQENSVKPVIAEKKKKSINWLFLLLGQMLGCCTLEQLKYFCKHTRNHRTGAKDRVLYLTYLGLCKQLYPGGPFDR